MTIGLNFKQPTLNQLSDLVLDKLVAGFEPIDSDTIPPPHVLQRGIDHSGMMADMWALPYFIQQSGKVIGCCGFKNGVIHSIDTSVSEDDESRTVEIGYNVAPRVRAHGIATIAVNHLKKIAFESGEVNKVVALIIPENKPSIAVVKKNGFVFHDVVTVGGELLEVWQVLK